MNVSSITRAVAISAILGLAAAAAGRGPSAESRWTKLGSVSELAAKFNEDEGSTRIVLLLSPT